MSTQTTEETGLATREQTSTELHTQSAAALAQFEIQGAIVLANKYPRNEDACFAALMKSCARPNFAEDVVYSFPRGGSVVTGASIYLAREGARIWGNIRHGVYVIADDEHSRTIRAWAWDLQTNTKVEAEDSFEKLIYRKKGGWIKPDERDLRELTNRRAAILKRNCILELLPSDLIEDAVNAAAATLTNQAKSDPDRARKSMIVAFQGINVAVENLEAYLGHKVAQCSPAELVQLRQIFKAIREGQTTWLEVVTAKDAAKSGTEELADKLKEKASKASNSPAGATSGANGQSGQESGGQGQDNAAAGQNGGTPGESEAAAAPVENMDADPLPPANTTDWAAKEGKRKPRAENVR